MSDDPTKSHRKTAEHLGSAGAAASPTKSSNSRYVAAATLLFIVIFSVGAVLGKHRGVAGVAAGKPIPVFAVPLALGGVVGKADLARHANEGSNGKVPACRERGPGILNICALYERSPVVLALFVSDGCNSIVGDLQRVSASFPNIRFAAVALNGNRSELRRLIQREGIRLPVGVDTGGSVSLAYGLVSCPQIIFAYPGGVAQGRPLTSDPGPSALADRVNELDRNARARGWRPQGTRRNRRPHESKARDGPIVLARLYDPAAHK
jgi:hypothetical protein